MTPTYVPIYCRRAALRDWPRLPSKQTNQKQRAQAGRAYASSYAEGKWRCNACGRKVLVTW